MRLDTEKENSDSMKSSFLVIVRSPKFKQSGNIKSIFLLILLVLSFSSFGQREKYFQQFSTSYFDSVRVLLHDTAKEYYTIKAYRLSGADKIIIDGQLNESA